MALYVYKITDGSLVSWAPNDSDPVAEPASLAEKGLSVVSGQHALDSSHSWDVSTKTVVVVTPRQKPLPISTGLWILRFTPQEFQAISTSPDGMVQQFMYALNHTTEIDLSTPQLINGVSYLASVGLVQQTRVAEILADPTAKNG